MRIRSIKPGFFQDDELADTGRDARLLYIGLWCMADREGKLAYRSKKIKAAVFPYDDDIPATAIDDLIRILTDARFLIVYNHGEKRFIKIRTFLDHQVINHREANSEIPDPDQAAEPDRTQAGQRKQHDQEEEETDDGQTPGRENPGHAQARRGTHRHAHGEGKGREGERKGKEGKGAVTTAAPAGKELTPEPEKPDPGTAPGSGSRKKKITPAAEKPRENVVLPFGQRFADNWNRWKIYRREEHGFFYKSAISEEASITHLRNISGDTEEGAIAQIDRSIQKGWKGFFKPDDEKNINHGKNNGTNQRNKTNHTLPTGNKSEGYRGL